MYRRARCVNSMRPWKFSFPGIEAMASASISEHSADRAPRPTMSAAQSSHPVLWNASGRTTWPAPVIPLNNKAKLPRNPMVLDPNPIGFLSAPSLPGVSINSAGCRENAPDGWGAPRPNAARTYLHGQLGGFSVSVSNLLPRRASSSAGPGVSEPTRPRASRGVASSTRCSCSGAWRRAGVGGNHP